MNSLCSILPKVSPEQETQKNFSCLETVASLEALLAIYLDGNTWEQARLSLRIVLHMG